ncbi:MAG: hypothetical protein AAGA69_12460, partial [Pseudomonadota bacterium]
CTVHIYYGKAPDRPAGFTDAQFRDLKKDVMEIRRTEIQEIASFLADRQKRERRTELMRLKDKGWDTEQSKANYILLGDFNIVSPEHETMAALKDAGFEIPEGMENLPTTLGQEVGFYDQIAHRLGDARVRHRTSGAVDFRKACFGPQDAEHYIDVVKDPYILGKPGDGRFGDRADQVRYFNFYRFKHQMSDHQLLWSAFEVDLADRYLERLESEALAGGD